MHRIVRACAALGVCAASAAWASSPTMTLAPGSPTLTAIGASANDLLMTAVTPAPAPMPAPVVGLDGTAIGLLPGDVVTGVSFSLMPAFGPS